MREMGEERESESSHYTSSECVTLRRGKSWELGIEKHPPPELCFLC